MNVLYSNKLVCHIIVESCVFISLAGSFVCHGVQLLINNVTMTTNSSHDHITNANMLLYTIILIGNKISAMDIFNQYKQRILLIVRGGKVSSLQN